MSETQEMQNAVPANSTQQNVSGESSTTSTQQNVSGESSTTSTQQNVSRGSSIPSPMVFPVPSPLSSDLTPARKFFMSVVSCLETICCNYGVDINGWSEATYENISDYDGVLCELYQQYRELLQEIALPAEIRLFLMMLGSVWMFYLSKRMFADLSQGQCPCPPASPCYRPQAQAACSDPVSPCSQAQAACSDPVSSCPRPQAQAASSQSDTDGLMFEAFRAATQILNRSNTDQPQMNELLQLLIRSGLYH